MKLNNRGFAISGILYSLLILFLVLLLGILSVMATAKFSFDTLKSDLITKLTNGSKGFIYVDCDRYTIKRGFSFDLMKGVKIVGADGNSSNEPIVTTSAPTFNSNTLGSYTITYEATYQGVVLTAIRTVIVADVAADITCTR